MSSLIVRQSKGFWPVAFASFWERFSFYGFRSFLAIYMSAKLLYSDALIFETYAAMMAIMYVAPLVGGYMADRYIGRRLAISVGLGFTALSHFILCWGDEALFDLGLTVLLIGTGYFKPNVSASITDFYEQDDPRRESGFTYHFTLVNAGALLAPLCGLFAQEPELIFKMSHMLGLDLTPHFQPSDFLWRSGFFLAGFVAIIGLVIFHLQTNHTHFRTPSSVHRTPWWLKIGALLASVLLCALLYTVFKTPLIANSFLILAGIASLGFWMYMSKQCAPTHKKALWAGFVLICYQVSFIAVIEQFGSTISLFIHRNLDRVIYGVEIPASVFQGIWPLFTVILGPLLAILWVHMAKKNQMNSAPFKFAMSLLLLGIGVVTLGIGCHQAIASGLVNIGWIFLFSMLCALSELCILPAGMSLITQIAPPQYTSLVTAIWFLSRAFAYYLGGVIAKGMLSVPASMVGTHSVESLLIYKTSFYQLGAGLLCLGVIIYMTAPSLTRMLEQHLKTLRSK
jgi:POT family proton-dependent oligopeptide transporter